MRYVLECVWSGYTSSQSRYYHIEVLSPKKAEIYKKIYMIKFTDNTCMSVRVREAKYREHVNEMKGYLTLFKDILRQGLTEFISIEDVKGE